jgi:hypothetical protein
MTQIVIKKGENKSEKFKKSIEDKIETNFDFYKLFQIKQILTKRPRTKLKIKRSKRIK